MWSRDAASAAPLINAALQQDPNLGLAHEENGFLLFQQGKDAEAAAEFSKAYTLDPSLYLSLFAKTMMSSQATSHTVADEAKFHDDLLKVADLNPRFAPAYVQMAALAVRQGNLSRAYSLARKAEQLEPSRAEYHLMTGEILLRMGRDAEAASYAEFVAKLWHGPDHDEAVELWDSIPENQRPDAVTFQYDIPIGTKAATGVIEQINCGTAAGNNVILRSDGKLRTFRMTDRHLAGIPDTLWYGSDHFGLCHHLNGMPAILRYRPDAQVPDTGEMVELEMRDPLPASEVQTAENQPAKNL